jgi:hypothetical protein
MDREGGVIGFNNGVRDLGRRNDREGGHHAVWELFSDLGDEQGSHTSTSTTAERVGDLESLETITALSFATDDIKNLVDKFSTFGVMAFSPIVACNLCYSLSIFLSANLTSATLTEDKVVRTEELTEGTSTDSVHSTGLEIDEDCTRDIFVASGL